MRIPTEYVCTDRGFHASPDRIRQYKFLVVCFTLNSFFLGTFDFSILPMKYFLRTPIQFAVCLSLSTSSTLTTFLHNFNPFLPVLELTKIVSRTILLWGQMELSFLFAHFRYSSIQNYTKGIVAHYKETYSRLFN